ncbi:hypothetical protein EOVG_00178 [Emiliania huxleyi virus 88]|nr:hypothetical protein EOVG_00178 [Emiliania huxleyi virus 88]
MSLHTTLDIIESHKDEMPEGLYLNLMNSAKRKYDELGSSEPEKLYRVGMFKMVQQFVVNKSDDEQSMDIILDNEEIDPGQFMHAGVRQLVSEPTVTPVKYKNMTLQEIKNLQDGKVYWDHMSLLTNDILSQSTTFPIDVGYSNVRCRIHNFSSVCTRTHHYIISVVECN